MIFLTGFILLNFCVGNYGGGLLSVAFSLSSSKFQMNHLCLTSHLLLRIQLDCCYIEGFV